LCVLLQGEQKNQGRFRHVGSDHSLVSLIMKIIKTFHCCFKVYEHGLKYYGVYSSHIVTNQLRGGLVGRVGLVWLVPHSGYQTLYYWVFREQADWTLTHTSHKDTEQRTIDA
jgi:hypothetical protein